MSWWGLVKQRKNAGSSRSSRLASSTHQKIPPLSTTSSGNSPRRFRQCYRICLFLVSLLLVGMILSLKSSSSSSWLFFRYGTVFATVDEEQRNSYQQQQQKQQQQQQPQQAATLTTATHQVAVLQRHDMEQGRTTTTPTTTYQRAIFLISMGKDAAESAIVERCIVSIRRRGQWKGPVVLLTDAPSERYQLLTPVRENQEETSNHHDTSPAPPPPPLTIVVHPQRDHFNWNTLKDDMPYKRFKTFVLEYLDRDSRLDAIELVYYLDVDIVVGAPLDTYFQYAETTYQIPLGRPPSQPQQQSLHRLYLYKGNYPLPVQSGQLIMERYHTRNCLERWRSWLDNDHDLILDQLALRNVLNETTMENTATTTTTNNNSDNKKHCQLVLMEQEPHLHFPTKKTMVQMSSGSTGATTSTNEPPLPWPTLIHIKNSKTAGQIQWSIQKKFFRHILQLSPIEESEGVLFVPSGTSTVHSNASITMGVVSAAERRIKVARPMIILPSKAWSQQQQQKQQQQHGNEPTT
jgi:hypothetical protein